MGKPTNEDKSKEKEYETKILFKKSNAIFTHSRTCSGTSTKSGNLQGKKALHFDNYSLNGTKLKKDLSIETDAYILRRYYKTKRNKISNQGSTVASSVMDTEIKAVEELPDTSACGDNEIMEKKSIHRIDIAALIVDNLKDLLNQWIQKHLLFNRETQKKLNGVLDSILHKIDNKNKHRAPSDSTYVLQNKKQRHQSRNKQKTITSISCQHCKTFRDKSIKDSSTITVPCHFKDVEIVSTLSIPKSVTSRGKKQHKSKNSSSYKLGKHKHKNLVLSVDDSIKRYPSRFDLLAKSTRSITKRCVNYDINIKKKRHVVCFAEPSYKSFNYSSAGPKHVHEKSVTNYKLNKNQLDEMSSLLRSIYTNTNINQNLKFDDKTEYFFRTEPEAITHNDDSHVMVNKNINPRNQNDYNVAKDYSDKNVQFSTPYKTTYTNTTHIKTKSTNIHKISTEKGKNKKGKSHSSGHKVKSNIKFNNSKQFTFLYKKANNQVLQRRAFIKYCQNVLQYYTESDSHKNVKVDVQINVFPMFEPRAKNVWTDISNQTLNEAKNTTVLYDVQPTVQESQSYIPTLLNIESEQDAATNSSQFTPKIIPLLDGAVSQSKYIFEVNSREKLDVNSNVILNRSTVTANSDILQVISDLRTVMKDLAATAEKFVNEQLRKNSCKSDAETLVSDNYTSNSKYETTIAMRNPSKTTQVSEIFKDIAENRAKSGVAKKRDMENAFKNFKKRSKEGVSRRTIDSGSSLKITRMSTKADEINIYNCKLANQALMYSLPKSKSLYEMTTNRNKELLAYLCNSCVDPRMRHTVQRESPCTAPSQSKSSKTSVKSKKWRLWSKKGNKAKNKTACQIDESRNCCPYHNPDGEYSSLSDHSLISIIDTEESDEMCEACKDRRSMGFSKKCAFCLLLLIVVLIIAYLLYSYVLKDVLLSVYKKSNSNPTRIRNDTLFNTKLSDLGF